MFEKIVIVTAIIIVLLELYGSPRAFWLQKLLEQEKKAKRPRKPMVLKPKSERDCRFCQEEKGKRSTAKREQPEPWNMRKGRGDARRDFDGRILLCQPVL